jgi:hypothetical protein
MKDQAAINRWSGRQLVALLIVISPIYFFIPITHDAAWQMWIGRQMAHGANLYTDIIEVNPPLWFWISVPLARTAELLHVRSLAVLIAFFLLAIAGSLWLVRRIKSESLPLWPMAAAMLFPLRHFGQREHFILIFAIPYVLLIARRERGESVSGRLATLIGACGALAFALKPQFAILPLLLELWAWRARRLRPETITLGVAALVYVALIFVFERDFLTAAIPLVMAAYENFAPMELESIGRSLIPYAYAFPLLLYARREAAAFTISSLAFFLVYLVQSKGWEYQVIPAQGMLFVAVVLSATGSVVRKTLGLAAGILILLPHVRPYETPGMFRLNVPHETSFAALSISPRAAWPLVEERQLKWPLPYLSLWMAPTIMPSVANDLACNPPDLLLIDDRTVDFSSLVASLLRDYVRIDDGGPIKLYKRTRLPPRGSGCRTVH